jgi:hypothetical protein
MLYCDDGDGRSVASGKIARRGLRIEMRIEFPGRRFIADPIIDWRYEIEIQAGPAAVWPWLRQLGYHRGGWYIDTWWDRISQQYFWPLVVPKEARGTYARPADRIHPEYQNLSLGDIVPDGPPDSAFYEVVDIEENRLLLLYATTHFDYMAPRWVYRTRLAPSGAFCWAFMLSQLEGGRCRLTSWWQAKGGPKLAFTLMRPLLAVVDGAHQRAILRGIKKRAESVRDAA